jgi:plasmid rolling circle replication initiator protein Rep
VVNITLSSGVPASPAVLMPPKRANGAGGQPPKGGLGSVTFFPSAQTVGVEEKLRQARDGRFQLQKTIQYMMRHMTHVRKMTNKETGEKVGRELGYRVVNCMRGMRVGENRVNIRKTSQGASYSNLQMCASGWTCPVCAAKITNERRKDINDVIVAAGLLGYKPVMLTFTARHRAYTDLEDQLKAMLDAFSAMWSGRPFRRFEETYLMLGHIRALECTWHPRNGWHPHFHVIIFVPRWVQLADVSAFFGPQWKEKAAAHGLTMNQHGFDATDVSTKIANYIDKFGYEPTEETLEGWKTGKWWNEADELSRWFSKRGEKMGYTGFTPWQIAELFQMTGDADFMSLFQDYAKAFLNRHQVDYSTGLRKKLGLGKVLTDEEAVNKELEGTHILDVGISPNDWYKVRLQGVKMVDGVRRDSRAFLLDLVERHDDVQEFQKAIHEWFGFIPMVVIPRPKSDSSLGEVDGEGT